ncbi:MAG: hypothetical protein E7435_00430 [Ruminococcaceae bacterium]|nr:hypothetical protein [Oscillospiraceae bacterium]
MQVHNQVCKVVRLDGQTIFVLCWSLGLTLGAYTGFYVGRYFSEYLYQAGYMMGGLPIFTTILPLLLMWFAAWHTLYGLIFPIMFMKAFTDGLVMVSLSCAFGSATWLFCPLLLLSDRIATVVQLLFAAQCLGGKHPRLHQSFLLCFATITAGILFDYLFVAPYFVSIMP